MTVAIPTLAAVVAATMGVVVLRSDPGKALNRRLALVLLAETVVMSTIAILQAMFGHEGAYSPEGGAGRWLSYVVFLGYGSLPAAYLYFVSLLGTPWVRWLRHRAARAALALSVLFIAVGGVVYGTPDASQQGGPAIALLIYFSTLSMVFAGLFAIVAAVSAARRTQSGTPLRHQATAFAVAFITRDILWAAVTALGIVTWSQGNEILSAMVWTLGPAFVALAYIPALGYGILRTQLFDIDLKLKIGIKRSTVATVMLLAIFGAAKVAEFYLNTTYGFLAGGIAAGSVLFLAPRLNKFGDKIANTALPKVQDTNAYREFRKLEVFKAAVESALEGGELTTKERDAIGRLRLKLGIGEPDALALEADVRERLAIPAV